MEPIQATIKTEQLTTFEDGFDGWDAHSWTKLDYYSNVATDLEVVPPPSIAGDTENLVSGIVIDNMDIS